MNEATAPWSPPLLPREALTVARILKVNHAGEHGAIRINGGQIAVAQLLYPEVVAKLAELREHEVAHRTAFAVAMPSRQARPCRAMFLWAMGGSILGFATAMLGRQAIWITTAAVEAAVHRHLDDQLHFLNTRDLALYRIIADIREEELAHLRLAEANIERETTATRLLSVVISWSTDALIWLSTWGDLSRMAKDLNASKIAP